jgi:hypothetical protein
LSRYLAAARVADPGWLLTTAGTAAQASRLDPVETLKDRALAAE